MSGRATILLLLVTPAIARPEPPASTPPAPPAVAAPSSASAPDREPRLAASRFSVEAGWGYYEVSHLGAAYHFNARAALALFGGYGLGPSDQGGTLGASFSHALFGPVWGFQPGWDLKAVYWTQSDAYYGWKVLTLVLGPRFETALEGGLGLAIDAGVGLSFALETDRKQDFTFGAPTRWNGSVCLEISYRLGGR